MARAILNAGMSGQTAGNARYFSEHHHAKGQRIALHTAAVNALSMSSWNLSSDSGSLGQAISKAESAVVAMRRLQQMGGAA